MGEKEILELQELFWAAKKRALQLSDYDAAYL
jgi:hypothetical protein